MSTVVAVESPRVFLTAAWRHLVMLNFEVEPAVLEPLLTPGLELDYFQGTTYLSVVGFRFLDTRVFGIPALFHRAFDEVNLRFYVKRVVNGETRRGVMFIKELVQRRLVAWAAWAFYNENYFTVPLASAVVLPNTHRSGHAKYEWVLGGRKHMATAEISGEAELPAPGSEPEFIAEHYWGYSRQRDGGTMEYRVEHPPWRVWQADSIRFECDAALVYGPEFAHYLNRPPTSAFVADGSEVVVRRGVCLK